MNNDIAHVFHAYDIRGLAPEELDSAFAERLGRVIAHHFKPKHVMIGRDMRTSSPELEASLIKGLTESGVQVTRIGLCSTPMFNVLLGLGQGIYDFGMMVTASHNPAKYNGFKMADGNVYPIGQGSGMEEIRDRYLSDETFPNASSMGTVSDDTEAKQKYLDHIFAQIDVSALPAMKIAADAANGMNGFLMEDINARLPQIEILPLYWELDGQFPNHEANPLKKETLKDLQALVAKEQCDFGVAFDGDGDRVGFVDEKGEAIEGGYLTALFAKALLHEKPGSLILRDLRCTWATAEEIEAAGGTTDMTRVGHAFIKRQLRESGALFAGEISMHFYFGSLWGVESSDLCLLLMLKLVSESGKPLSELWTPMKRYINSGEVNSEVKDKEGVLKKIKESYEGQASSVITIDGIRMEFNVAADGTKGEDAWWFSVRPSNTEPLMRLIVEAVNQELMEAKRDELLALIRS